MQKTEIIESIKRKLAPSLAEIVELMEVHPNPYLLDIPENSDGMSEDSIAELIAKANNSVNKVSQLRGAAQAAFKMQEPYYKLVKDKSLDNEGKNEDQRKALAAQASEDDCNSLRIAEACFRYIDSIYDAVIVNSQSARKLVDDFNEQSRADSRENKYGKTPAK